MYRFFEGAASTYSATYYRSRLSYYGFLSFMVGCLQIALGSLSQQEFGWGQLPAPVVSGPFFILWPEISIAVGVCQVNTGKRIACCCVRQTEARFNPPFSRVSVSSVNPWRIE